MTDDPLKSIEDLLAELRPEALPDELIARIGADLAYQAAPPLTWADRLVGGYMALSAAAAAFVVAVTAWQLLTPPPALPPAPPAHAQADPRREFERMLALGQPPAKER
jgi:hypothetical protein